MCLLFAHSSLAVQYCAGKVLNVLMYSNGTVMIVGSWRGDFTVLCSIQGDWGSIPSETCFAWYGAALKARADNSNVTIYYPSDQGYTCANMPTYGGALVPGYFMVNQ